MNFQSWLAFPIGILLCCALQTSAVQQPTSCNCTSDGQRISFSHSYKIDLPTSSQIKVEADPLQHEDSSEVQPDPGETEENEEQNIIFRHNIRVHTPKGDCEALTHIKALIERMERLKKEVAELREVCSPQKCCGGSQGVSHCSGHGIFLYETCSCKCAEGWEGTDCSRPTCPNHCSSHGRCDGGKCICDEPYFGKDCSQQLCPENCSGNGICDTAEGVCQCYEEFIGEDCSEKRCPGDCIGNGFCDTGECYCHDGFFGLDCSQVLAPQNLQLLNSTESSLAVSWDQIVDVDNYLISYYPVGYGTLMKQVHVPKEQLSYKIVGLRPSTTYNVTLHHVKKGITSEPEYLEASTALSALNAIWVMEEMEHSLEVEWENPPTAVDYYKLKFRSLVEMDEKQVIVPKSNDPKSRHIMTGLKPGTEYEVTIVPVKDSTEGKPSSVSGRTGIDSPTNVATDRVTEDTATISWNRVEAPIDKYMVRYTSADGDIKEIEVGSENDTTTLSDLKPGIEYVIHIWAEKGTQRSKKASTRAVTGKQQWRDLSLNFSFLHQFYISQYSFSCFTQAFHAKEFMSFLLMWLNRPPAQHEDSVLRPVTGTCYGKAPVTVKNREELVLGDHQAALNLPYPVSHKDFGVLGTFQGYSVSTGLADVLFLVYASSWCEIEQLKLGYRERCQAVPQCLQRLRAADKDKWKALEAKRLNLSGTGNARRVLASQSPVLHLQSFIYAIGLQICFSIEIDPPKNLCVSDVTHSTGVVTWTPPAAQIDGYTLTYQDQDGTHKEVQLSPSEQRFVLEGLEQGVRYTVFVMAYKGDHQSRKTDSTFSTVSFLHLYPADCSQIQRNGNASSGMYTIYLNGDGSSPMEVYCDMTTDGGGWIVFQRRTTGEVDFYKRWKNYVEGFGDPTGEFWLGLDKLHNLTSSSPTPYELRVDLRTASESVYAVYNFFQVASSRDRYRLSVGNYTGNAGDAMTYHNGWKFTTWDRDNDVALSNCALTHHGAWWYKNCHLANLNGKYGETKHSEGVNWEPWKGHEFSIPFTEMKIRPQSSSNEPVLRRKKRSHQGR
ncbi:TENN protein, partial [Geococcyx californianus]|nr:TENN protein [Geococcyx californianus]